MLVGKLLYCILDILGDNRKCRQEYAESFASITAIFFAVHIKDKQLQLCTTPTPLQIYPFFYRSQSNSTSRLT
jgi:hypothetical protein